MSSAITEKVIAYQDLSCDVQKLFDNFLMPNVQVVVQRRHGQDVVMLLKNDFDSIVETAYLLRDPANAAHLLRSREQALNNDCATLDVDNLWK